MFQATLRSTVRPAAQAAVSARSAVTSTSTKTVLRALSTTPARLSDDHHGPPELKVFGPGAKAGTIPSDVDQATGLERLELLAEMQGVKLFDEEPLDSSRLGTLDNPVKVYSLDTQRIIGCTGSPADSHDLHWFTLTDTKNRRCPECGSVYKLDFQGDRELLAQMDHH